MKSTRQRINESKDVSVYKKLLTILTQWSDKFPMTGIDGFLEKATDKGKSILPKDKRALSILDYVVSMSSFSAAVSALLNTRFSDLPADLKPLAKIDRRCQLAFWNKNGIIGDMVKDLINFEDSKASCFFSDMHGNKVTLLDTEVEEQE